MQSCIAMFILRRLESRRSQSVFQALEKETAFFPTIGTFHRHFFRALENFIRIFPRVGSLRLPVSLRSAGKPCADYGATPYGSNHFTAAAG
jgi:hypothetical protein